MATRASISISIALLVCSWARAASAAPTLAECLDASEKGQEHRDNGKLSRAAELFTACSAGSCPGPVRASCARWYEGVVSSMPTIVVVARNDADEDVRDASLAIDGAPREKISGRPVALDPGPHTIAVTAPGHEHVEQSVVLNVSEKNRFVRVRLPRTAKAAPAAEVSAPATPPAPPAPPRSSVAPLVIGLGGLAVVSAGASLFMGLSTRSDLSDLRHSPCAATRTCSESTTDGIRTRLIVADVALGVAALSAAAAAFVWLTQPKSSGESARAAHASSSSSRAPASWPGYATAAATVAGAAGFAYFGGKGLALRNDLDACRPSCSPAVVDEGNRDWIAADVSLGIAALAAATTLYLWGRERSVSLSGRAANELTRY